MLEFALPLLVFSTQYGPFTLNSSEFRSFSLIPNDEILFFLAHPGLAFVVHSRADEVIASVNTVTDNATSHLGYISPSGRSFGVALGSHRGWIYIHSRHHTMFTYSSFFIPSACNQTIISTRPRTSVRFEGSAHGQTIACFGHISVAPVNVTVHFSTENESAVLISRLDDRHLREDKHSFCWSAVIEGSLFFEFSERKGHEKSLADIVVANLSAAAGSGFQGIMQTAKRPQFIIDDDQFPDPVPPPPPHKPTASPTGDPGHGRPHALFTALVVASFMAMTVILASLVVVAIKKRQRHFRERMRENELESAPSCRHIPTASCVMPRQIVQIVNAQALLGRDQQ
jgi:hypothetical protein